jgi:hypothetical protein
MEAIYTRLNAVRKIFAWDLESGVSWLKDQEDAGLITAVGVFDENTRTLYMSWDRPNPFADGDGVTDYYGQLRALGIDIKKVEYFPDAEISAPVVDVQDGSRFKLRRSLKSWHF